MLKGAVSGRPPVRCSRSRSAGQSGSLRPEIRSVSVQTLEPPCLTVLAKTDETDCTEDHAPVIAI